jgi:hypothetical protein
MVILVDQGDVANNTLQLHVTTEKYKKGGSKCEKNSNGSAKCRHLCISVSAQGVVNVAASQLTTKFLHQQQEKLSLYIRIADTCHLKSLETRVSP